MTNQQSFTEEQKLAFVDAANPHQWYLTAVNLYAQSLTLWRERGRSQTTMSGPSHSPVTWDDTNRATFLLAAFAMENMLKAFRVYEYPDSVGEGYLKDITTHNLWKLAQGSSLVPYKNRDRWALDALSEGNESWARYPCGRNANDVRPEGQFTVNLWIKYRAMMALYTIKMQNLLTKGWTGPYGYYGTWEFTD
jgi:hypothetical protein